MSPRYLHHLTLPTGHDRLSPRSEVSAGTLRALAPILREAGGEIPGIGGGHRVRITRAQGCAVYTVDCAPPRPDVPRPPLVTCWLAASPEGAAAAWADAERLYLALSEATGPLGRAQRDLGTEWPAQPAELPWLAVLTLPGLAFAPAAAQWLGDFERCLAWALLEEGRL